MPKHTTLPNRFSSPTVAASPNAVVATSYTFPEDVWLTAVQPQAQLSVTTPRGRYYVTIDYISAGGIGFNLWAGYFMGNVAASYLADTGGAGNAASVMMIPVTAGDQLTMCVYANSNGQTGDLFYVSGLASFVPADRSSAGSIHYEAPGSGRGEIITNHFSGVAAGSDYPLLNPGQFEDWQVLGWVATLTTSSTVAARQPVFYGYGGNHTAGHANSAEAFLWQQTASTAITYSWAIDQSGQATINPTTGFVASMGLINRFFPGGTSATAHYFGVVTANIQTGDQWSAGTAVYMSWARPWTGATVGD